MKTSLLKNILFILAATSLAACVPTPSSHATGPSPGAIQTVSFTGSGVFSGKILTADQYRDLDGQLRLNVTAQIPTAGGTAIVSIPHYEGALPFGSESSN